MAPRTCGHTVLKDVRGIVQDAGQNGSLMNVHWLAC